MRWSCRAAGDALPGPEGLQLVRGKARDAAKQVRRACAPRARRQPPADRAAPAIAPRRTRRVASRATPLALALALALALPLAAPPPRPPPAPQPAAHKWTRPPPRVCNLNCFHRGSALNSYIGRATKHRYRSVESAALGRYARDTLSMRLSEACRLPVAESARYLTRRPTRRPPAGSAGESGPPRDPSPPARRTRAPPRAASRRTPARFSRAAPMAAPPPGRPCQRG